MADYIFVLISCLSWAASAVFINSGFRRMPQNERIWIHILTGLMSSLCFGVISQGAAISVIGGFSLSALNLSIFLSGVFAFILGTGSYYLCGRAFGKKTEYAAQFSNVKPMISVFLAFIVLKESFETSALAIASIGLMVSGVLVIFIGAIIKNFTWLAFFAGLSTALAWSFGELFMKIGLGDSISAINGNFAALLSSFIIYAVIYLIVFIKKRPQLVNIKKYFGFFALHGILSFGIGYPSFYESTLRIGFANTIIIGVFWPGLSVMMVRTLNRWRKHEITPMPATMIIAIVLLTLGSLAKIVSFH